MTDIRQTILTDDIKKFIFDGFSEHSIETVGFDGIAREQIAFVAYNDDKVIGAISVLPFYGALWIKYLFVQEKYRKHGIGSQLTKEALKFGKEQNLDFAFVETLSFQAPEFYQKFGFELEFTRKVHKSGISFHYLKKNL